MAYALFFIILFLGGLAAWAGNEFSRMIARQKLSFFGLRPRYSATLATVFFGMFTSFVALTLVAAFSEKARNTVVSMLQMESAHSDLQKDVFFHSRSRPFAALFYMGEPIAFKRFDGELLASEKEKLVYELIDETALEIGRRNEKMSVFLDPLPALGKPSDFIDYEQDRLFSFINEIVKQKSDAIGIVSARRSILFQGKGRIAFSVTAKVRVIRSGEPLSHTVVDGSLTEDFVLLQLFDFLEKLKYSVIEKGVLPIPSDREIIAVSYAQTQMLAKKICALGTKVVLRCYSEKDVFNDDCVTLRFQVEKPTHENHVTTGKNEAKTTEPARINTGK